MTNPTCALPADNGRFWSKVAMADERSCWLWQARIHPSGYGVYWHESKFQYAHRVAYLLLVGPIPEGLTIDHLCRVTACVNPAHMEAVTTKVNNLRSFNPMANCARQTHCIHGHEFDEANTIIRPNGGGRRCRACKRARDRGRPTKHLRVGP